MTEPRPGWVHLVVILLLALGVLAFSLAWFTPLPARLVLGLAAGAGILGISIVAISFLTVGGHGDPAPPRRRFARTEEPPPPPEAEPRAEEAVIAVPPPDEPRAPVAEAGAPPPPPEIPPPAPGADPVIEPRSSAEEILRWTSTLPGEAQSGNSIRVLTSWDNNLSLEWRGPQGEIGRLVVVAVVENGHPVIKARSFQGSDEAALKGEVLAWMTETLHG